VNKTCKSEAANSTQMLARKSLGSVHVKWNHTFTMFTWDPLKFLSHL